MAKKTKKQKIKDCVDAIKTKKKEMKNGNPK